MILKRYFSLVWANDAGLLLPMDILLISSAPIEFATPEDFISLKPKPE
ncbi:hypothetical protein OU5_1242 [Pseudomonas mandelii JR-1]|uniref:Uncharacterized protein n=1 Tax=Pseudomonas mandelii JR-1 TaxID=1147786 RepID=A0A024E6T1_9PSED|nr:hypothetical protein OU5_1242 [Pseudomonas mandelii JR-1]